MASPLSFAQIEGYWIAAGGSAAVAPVMAAIAFAESSADPGSKQAGQPYATTGWGLWQITPGNSEPQAGTDEQLLDPAVNAKAAVAKYNSQGLGAWTTYTTGAYQKFLQSATPVTPGTGTTVPFGGGSAGSDSGGDGSWTSALGGVFGDVGNGLFSIPGAIIGAFADVDRAVAGAYDGLKLFFEPSTYVRIGAGMAGSMFIVLGIVCLAREAKQ